MNSENKQEKIIEMFNEIAPSYDVANRVMSLGIDVSWRVDACNLGLKKIESKNIQTIADIACGTGDMLLSWQKQARHNNITINNYIGVDPSKEMLKIAESKLTNTTLHLGRAQDLNMIEDESVDIVSISYGLRNVVEYKEALSEFSRILKKGGILVVLDFFSKAKPSLLEKLTQVYTKKILPLIGGLISKNYAAYKYLPDSMDAFVTTDELSLDLKNVGINTEIIKGYSSNISHLVLGIKQ